MDFIFKILFSLSFKKKQKQKQKTTKKNIYNASIGCGIKLSNHHNRVKLEER